MLHDGTDPYPHALATVAELKRRNKRIVLLSNSGRRAGLNKRRLTEMGFNLGGLDGVVTSGEAAWLALRHKPGPPFSTLGRRCYLLTHQGDLDCVADLGLELVSDVADADFVFASGLDCPPHTLDHFRPVAEAAAARDLPFICSNPDRVAVIKDGFNTAPGALAALCEDLGGTVHYIGKPHRPIYQACLNALEGLKLSEIVAIGDLIEHDIKGANGIGIASAFVTGGIHNAGFAPDAGPEAHAHHLDQLCAKHQTRPEWVVPSIRW